MDAVLFLVGILFIVACMTGCCIYATTLYHIRQTKQLQLDEFNNQAKYHLLEKAMDKNLPPGRFGLDS